MNAHTSSGHYYRVTLTSLSRHDIFLLLDRTKFIFRKCNILLTIYTSFISHSFKMSHFG